MHTTDTFLILTIRLYLKVTYECPAAKFQDIHYYVLTDGRHSKYVFSPGNDT